MRTFFRIPSAACQTIYFSPLAILEILHNTLALSLKNNYFFGNSDTKFINIVYEQTTL
jgi:hypothetical protein